MSKITNYEALLVLSTGPDMTPIMREYIVGVLTEHREMVTALREIIAATTHPLNMARIDIIASAALAYVTRRP